jgi:hypothetical protein
VVSHTSCKTIDSSKAIATRRSVVQGCFVRCECIDKGTGSTKPRAAYIFRLVGTEFMSERLSRQSEVNNKFKT